MGHTSLARIGTVLLAAYVFITAYGTTRQWQATGSPFRQECLR
ncbi:MAG: hypothetical protein RLZZ468_1690 [Cyanobacteriota bacterium]|jgi:hypothetical protein